MQKDLLAELQLPKLDLKSIQVFVRQNSVNLACVIKKNNGHLKKTTTQSADSNVKLGSDKVNFPLSPTKENIEKLKSNFIIKKSPFLSENFVKNGLTECFQSAGTNFSLKSDAVGYDKVRSTENLHLLGAKCQINSGIPHCESTVHVDNGFLSESNVYTGTASSVESPRDGEAEIEIILDNSFKKSSESDPLSRNPYIRPLDVKSCEVPSPEGISSSSENISKHVEVTEKQFNRCVTREITGNDEKTFSVSNDSEKYNPEAQDVPLITPKKTKDITKIKGWRRKQFFVEKPTTVEFYSLSKKSLTLNNKMGFSDRNNYIDLDEEPGNKENAFVCHNLDEFLDQEADLNIGYEIPHLYAEYGIKLTLNEIVSRPNLSEKDIKEVEMRYCRPVSLPTDGTNLDDIKEENFKRCKRPSDEDKKPCKILKLEGNKKHSVKILKKQPEKLNCEFPTNSAGSGSGAVDYKSNEVARSKKVLSTIKLMSKLVGLVVYPGPFMPLHPIVQYHLDKIRSYRTTVDENWATFAASAVLSNTKKCKRSILPAFCCVKVEKEPTTTDEEKVDQKKSNKEKIKLKKCSVVIEKLDFRESNPWCMEHNCYDCVQCGLAKSNSSNVQPRIPFTKKPEKMEPKVEEEETVIISPRASFDRRIAGLLAKKVRLLKSNVDKLRNIDCLKNLKPDTIEFIKLKFVKESFLAGFINIWYLKPVPSGRSRAFLTFSQTSPVPNAINLRSSKSSLNNLPKVITEIVSEENRFDSNEYAILHCDGENWEIHGCLNITFGKSDKDVEQIFTSVELPELERLQEIAVDILNVKTVKWWVLDLSQRFKLIELNSGNFRTVVTRKKILKTLMSNLFGFIPLSTRKDFGNRIIGAYIIPRLIPFILIGPYYLLESRGVVLKDMLSSTIPFEYHGKENVTTKCPLKFFINSVIRNLESNDKILEGLWLYDKMCVDRTCYLEVVTTNAGGLLPNKHSVIDIEHGYSLNSLTNSASSGVTSGIIKRCDGKDELKTVTVYLYFNIFELGFLEGELQFDNSVIINHPSDNRTKMKSHKIGDWFISMIRRKIEFIPKDLVVRWFITKHKDDLRDRRPFNKFYLSGDHVLTKNGVFYLLEMSESRIEKLGLDKIEVAKAIGQCEVIKEVTELKNLASLMANPLRKTLSMDEVLTKAVKEIKDLSRIQKDLRRKKMIQQKQNSRLITSYLRMVKSLRIRFKQKMNMIEGIGKLFTKKNGDLSEEFTRKLKTFRVGWKYLQRVENQRKRFNKKAVGENFKVKTTPTDKLTSEKIPLNISSLQKSAFSGTSVLKKPVVKLTNISHDVNGEKDQSDVQLHVAKSNLPSTQFTSFKINYPKVLKSSVEIVKSGKINNTELSPNLQSNFPSKGRGFVKLTSPKLPENIKMYWKNWNINKLEVV